MAQLVFFDTNILIDHLRGYAQATEVIVRHPARAISAIVWMEVMAGAVETPHEAHIRAMLAGFETIDITRAIQERAIRIRKQQRLKLPDAIIFATAEEHDATLLTRDVNDFPQDRRVVVPYQI